jgi:hypothetical protein
MRLIYHDAGAKDLAGPPGGQRMRLLLSTAGHEVLLLEDAGEAGEPVDCVIEAFANGTGESPALACARSKGLPLVSLEPDVSAALAGRPALLKAHLEKAASVITFEPRAYDLLEGLLPESERLHSFLPFLDVGPYLSLLRDAGTHRETLAGRLLCAPDTMWLLTAAEMAPGDGLESYRQLSQALSGLTHSNWVLLVIGEGSARAEVEAALCRLPRERLRLLGALSGRHRRSIFVASDIFLWPGIGTSCGLELLEAQAAGLPVVAERNATVSHYIADGVTGRLSMPGNFASLANNILFLLRHENFRETYRQEASRSTPDRYGCIRAANDFNRALASLWVQE